MMRAKLPALLLATIPFALFAQPSPPRQLPISPNPTAMYKQACEGGSTFGCNNLGNSYLNGSGGLPKDPARAAALYKLACVGGNAVGCNNLGVLYRNGDAHLPKDLAQAVSLFKQACDGRSSAGCNNLGTHYFNGDGGLPKNLARAGGGTIQTSL